MATIKVCPDYGDFAFHVRGHVQGRAQGRGHGDAPHYRGRLGGLGQDLLL